LTLDAVSVVLVALNTQTAIPLTLAEGVIEMSNDASDVEPVVPV